MSTEILKQLKLQFDKSLEHSAEFVQVNKTLAGHSAEFVKVNNVLEEHSAEFVKVHKKIDDVEQQLELVAGTVSDNQSRLDRVEKMLIKHDRDIAELKEMMQDMATKEDINLILNAIDDFAKKTNKVDEEQVVLADTVRQHTDRLDKHDADLKQLKPLVNLT